MGMTRRKLFKLAFAVGGGLFGGWAIGSGTADYLIHRVQVGTLTQIRALPTIPKIVTRQEWGARPVNHQAEEENGFAVDASSIGWYIYQDDLRHIYRTIVIHHSGQMLITHQTIQEVQALHMEQNHWADIGYHYGIDEHGIIYEGRDIRVRGASVAGHNTGVMGVVVFGDFERERPLESQLTALQTLINSLTSTYGLTHLAGHYEFNPETECPGRHLQLYLNLLAQDAGLRHGTDGYTSPPSTARPIVEF